MRDDARVTAATNEAWNYITEGRGSLPIGFDSWLDRSDVRAMVIVALVAADGAAPNAEDQP